MPVTTAVLVYAGKRALTELSKRAREYTPQGRSEHEAREQLDEVIVDNAQTIRTLAHRIEATDAALANLSPYVQEVAQVLSDLIDYVDRYVSEQYEPDSAPPQEDRENVARDAAKAYVAAGSPEKREIIWAAFHNSFNPKFYKEGLYKVLWALIDKLEYPHFRVLKQLQDGKYHASAMPSNAEDYFFAHTMASMGLLQEATIGDGRQRFIPVPIALRLIEFASPLTQTQPSP